LPLVAEAAISTASPLKGTGAFVAAVTVNCPAGAAAIAAVLGCGWNVPIGWVPGSGESASPCPALAGGECSWADIADAEAAAASAVGASAAEFADSGLAAGGGCCSRPFCATTGGRLVVDGSAAFDVVVAPSVAGVAADFPDVSFGATGAAAATALVNAALFAGVALACVAWGITGAAIAALATAEFAPFVVAIVDTVVVVVVVVAVGPVVSESVLG
jgi:hypothetical protein